MRPPSPSIPEKDFFFAALDQNLRLDGRTFLEPRPLDLSFGPQLGHVECSLGKTRSVATRLSPNLTHGSHEQRQRAGASRRENGASGTAAALRGPDHHPLRTITDGVDRVRTWSVRLLPPSNQHESLDELTPPSLPRADRVTRRSPWRVCSTRYSDVATL
jgi:hypothetical protein